MSTLEEINKAREILREAEAQATVEIIDKQRQISNLLDEIENLVVCFELEVDLSNIIEKANSIDTTDDAWYSSSSC